MFFTLLWRGFCKIPDKIRRQIKEDYFNLTYVAYKGKYLFPVPPRPIPSAFVYWVRQKRKGEVEFPNKVYETTPMKSLLEYFKSNQEFDPEIKQSNQEWLKKKMDYYTELISYQEKYINPLKVQKLNDPLRIFIR